MKKLLSGILAIIMLAAMCTVTLNVSGAEDPIVMYNLRAPDGTTIPYGQGRVNKCYFPDPDKSGVYGTPEMYPFGTCELSMDGGFVKMTPKSEDYASIVFDTVPTNLYINDYTHNYLSFMVCAEKAFAGKVKLIDLAGKRQKIFNVDFTGKWQKVTLDMSGADGWFEKDEKGEYTVPSTVAPYSADVESFFGGFKFYISGSAYVKHYHFDYFGFFTEKSLADNYSGLAAEGTPFAKINEEKVEEGFVIKEGRDEENTAVLYNMRVPLGEQIPYGQGRVNKCYFPDPDKSGKYNTPEIYPFGTCELTQELGFTKLTTKSGDWATVVFDTVPKNLYTDDYEHNYLSFMVCSEKAFSGKVKLVDLAGKRQKIFNVDFTGKWQRVTIDISGADGWFEKDENGEYTVPSKVAPYSEEIKSFFGGFKFYISGSTYVKHYYFDYFGFFKDKEKAENYSVMATAGESFASDLFGEAEGEVMESVTFYKENKGEAFLYELRPQYGKEIPYGDSKYAPTKCYYPLGKGGDMERPEMYTWGSGSITVEGDYVKFAPTDPSQMRITFDTSPESYYMSYDKPYFTMVAKTSRAFDGEIGFKTLDSNYQKFFPVSFTGEWQKVILDLSDPNGWTKRDANKEYHLVNQTPFCKEINKLYGGHAMLLPGKNDTDYIMFDYIMMFDSTENAKAFSGLAKVESAQEFSAEELRTIMSAKSRAYISIMTGYSDGTFRPNQGMTRAEAATVLARLMDRESVIARERETAFTEISKSDWYYGYVSYLERYGIFDGIFSGEFKASEPITRAEFVKLCANAGAFDPASVKNPTKSFSDVTSETRFATEIIAAAEIGFINGYSDGTFGPSKTLTRAEITTILTRILDISERKDKAQYYSDLDSSHWAYGIIMAVTSTADFEKGTAKIAEVDALTAKRIEEIKNTPTTVVPAEGCTAYYVSAEGNDANDGKSPETAWKTLRKVSEAAYKKGDVVYFRRGDIFRIPDDLDALHITKGVSYSAYGEGEKPRIYGSPEDGADASKWSLFEGTTNIWKYERRMIDQGTLIFNGGESWATTSQVYYKNDRFEYVDGTPIDVKTFLKTDLSMFCETIPESGVPIPSRTLGYLYLRCDAGNPGEVFDSIEFMPSRHLIKAQNSDYHFENTVIENICVMYGGAHAIHATSSTNFTVKDCIFGFIGGGHQSFSSTTSVGSLKGRGVRYGNAIETGYANGYYVYNNYIYQCYDCGITFQSTGANVQIYDTHFDNNVIEKCQYSVEYWVDPADKDVTKYHIYDFTINNNIMREAGIGISSLRPDKTSAAHIKAWTKYNAVKDNSYVISGNIFDRSTYMMIHIGLPALTAPTSKPIMKNNTWIQHLSTDDNTATFGEYEMSVVRLAYTDDILEVFKKYGIEDTEVYFVK